MTVNLMTESGKPAGGLTLVKRFFEDDDDGYGRKVELNELKALSVEDKQELVLMVEKELGVN